MSNRPSEHMLRDRCTCEYAIDDYDMEMEYKVAASCGQEVFDSVSVGDTVEYYTLPWSERRSVHMPEEFKWEYLEKNATRKHSGVVESKTERYILVGAHKMSSAECWL